MKLPNIVAKIPALPKISPTALLAIALLVIGLSFVIALGLPALPAVAVLACKAIAALSLIGLVLVSLTLSITQNPSSNPVHPGRITADGAFSPSATFGRKSVADASLSPTTATPLAKVDARLEDCPDSTSLLRPTHRA